MAAPARGGRAGLGRPRTARRRVVGIVVAGVWVVSGDDSTTPARSDSALSDSAGSRSPRSRSVVMHGTRPPRLVADDIARASTAFGITGRRSASPAVGRPRTRPQRSTSASRRARGTCTFENASLLLEPAGDRAAICAATDAARWRARCRTSSSSPTSVACHLTGPTAAAAGAASARATAGLLRRRVGRRSSSSRAVDVPPVAPGSRRRSLHRQVVPSTRRDVHA